jgi:MPBQ/MSBQ methyltransferase
MVIACWCQREAGVNGAPPLSSSEQEELNFLYEEWAHPFFISMQEFCRLMEVRRPWCSAIRSLS